MACDPGPAARRLPDLLLWAAGNVLDVRPPRLFAAGHLPGSVNLPLSEQDVAGDLVAAVSRKIPSILLPPRHEPLLVVGDRESQVRICLQDLRARGRRRLEGLVLTPQVLAALPAGLPAAGPGRGHLWRPPAYLVRHADLLPPAAAGPALDLACGSGRAAVWLAAKGYRVLGVDHQPQALALAERLAADRRAAGLAADCRFVPADLRLPQAVPPGPWSLALAFRFLHRPLLQRLADLLAPAGVAVVRTYRLDPTWRGGPHRRHCLEPGELAEMFPPERFRILAYEEGWDDDGSAAAGIVARRRAAP